MRIHTDNALAGGPMPENSYGQDSDGSSVPTFRGAVGRFTEPLCSLCLQLLQLFRTQCSDFKNAPRS